MGMDGPGREADVDATERSGEMSSDRANRADQADRATRRIARRELVAGAAALVASAGLAPILGACGPSAATPTTGAPTAAPTTAAAPTIAPTRAAVASPAAGATPARASAASPAASPATSPAAQGVPGGTLRATLGAEPTTLDPHKSSTLFDRDVADALYAALIDDDVLEGVQGALAESFESSDAKTWTVRLRRGLKFHDGSEITADVVKASMERVTDPATGAGASFKSRVDQVAAITTPDQGTIRFELKAPNAAFPLDLAEIKIVPRNFDPAKPVGSGAFQFVEWVRNQRVALKKFPDYYQPGLPYLDELVFLPTPDENQKIVLLQTGQVEFTDTIPLPRVQEVQQGGRVQVFGIPAGVSPSSYFMLARTDRPPLDNPKVRQAISYAIDRQALLDTTFDVGTVKSNLVPPKHWAFNPNAPSYNDRNVARARQLLAEASQQGGFSVQLKHITSRAEFSTIAQLVQANLAEVGIRMEIVPLEIGIWVDQVLNKHDFQLGLTGIIPGPDPDDMLVRFSVDRSTDGKAMNWKNDEYERLLAQGRAVVAQEERKRIYFRAQEIGQEATPGFILNERPILYGASPAVQGFRPDIRQHTHFTTVWLKK